MRVLIAAVALPFVLAACASAPQTDQVAYEQVNAPERAASNALKMVGKPYRYGGATPAGFDCSGLVMHSYRTAGIALPHSTEAQRKISKRIKVAELRRGDLVFFDQEGKKSSHVGIYLGSGKFVHAPSSGKVVRADRLDNPYWKKHLSEVRRIAA